MVNMPDINIYKYTLLPYDYNNVNGLVLGLCGPALNINSRLKCCTSL